MRLEEEKKAEARALQEGKRIEKERRKEAREERLRKEEEEAREAMRIRKEEGRSKGDSRVKVDHRYYAVRSMQEHRVESRELNKRNDESVYVESYTGFQGEDKRWLRNYNIHSMEKQVNISCSYNPLCYTCFGEPHNAREGREGQPVTYVFPGAESRGWYIAGNNQCLSRIEQCTVTTIDVIFRYPDRVPLTHFIHRAKKVFSMGA